MISLKEAIELIDNSVSALKPQLVPIAECAHCKLVEDLLSPINVPGFDNSAMDGIAIRFSDLTEAGPWKLKVQKTIAAGDSPNNTLEYGCAVKIMTGAPLPVNADSVIPVEELTFHNDEVEISERPKFGAHIRPMGDDLRKGDLVFEQGHILKPVDVGVLASIGLDQLQVIPKPRIAIIATGSEIIAPGNELLPGQIYNSNDASLSALLTNAGFHPNSVLPPSIDVVETLHKRFEESLHLYDIVITTGGVSMGDFDYIPRVVTELGGEIIFHKVKIKPGKPVLLAKFNNDRERWLIGLPGNPVSVVAGYHLYIKKLLHNLMGISFQQEKVGAILTADIKVKGFRQKAIGITLEKTTGELNAVPALRQQSGRLASIRSVDGFILVEGGDQLLSAGSKVEVEVL